VGLKQKSHDEVPETLMPKTCAVPVQVAGQQGAYIARMINRGYTTGVGGLDQAPPIKVAADTLGKVSL
jgi:hypothetical protein